MKALEQVWNRKVAMIVVTKSSIVSHSKKP